MDKAQAVQHSEKLIDVKPIDGRSFTAAQAFLLTTKLWWTQNLYPALREEFDTSDSKKPQSHENMRIKARDTVLYSYYSWLERHLQRFKYSGRYGLQPYHAQDRDTLVAQLEAARDQSGILKLNEGFAPPDYFSVVDIHQHPGGILGDPIAGYVYERGARSTTPIATGSASGSASGNHRDLHDRFTDWVIADGDVPERIIDLGCGFGKSTQPFYSAFRDAEVIGVDLSEPCLKLAAHTAVHAQVRNVSFVQCDATETDFEDESFDLVTSTMMLHEMPPPIIEQSFDEAYRLLRPGGRMIHLDFYHLPDTFRRFVHYTHAERNNEPYMRPWAEMDAEAVLKEKGFCDIKIVPFEEADGVLAEDYPYWRFPWTVIAATR